MRQRIINLSNPIKLGLILAFMLYGSLQVFQHFALRHNLDHYTNPLYGSSKQYFLDALKASKLEFTQHQKRQYVSARAKETKGIASPLPESSTTGRNNSKIVTTSATQQGQGHLPEQSTNRLAEKVNEDREMLKVVGRTTASAVDKPLTKEEAEKIANHIAQQRANKAMPKPKPGRGIASKSPAATPQDWLDVMEKQPVFSETPHTPLKVGFVTSKGIKGPTKHVFYDGLQGSAYLDMEVLCSVEANNCTASEHDVDLWLVDANSAKEKPFPNDIVHQILAVDNPKFRIFFVDYSDRLVLRKGFVDWNYPDIEEERFLRSHVRFAIRCIDKYRRWAPVRGYINTGRLIHPLWDEMLITKSGPPLHAPFAVRTDIADSIHEALRGIASGDSSCSPLPLHPVDCIPSRPIDIIHLWAIETPPQNSNLRNMASEMVQNMSNWTHPTASRKLRTETSIQGNRAHVGRQHVSDDYVKAILQSKIVVVTQRDQWEDHFRLFEALAGGAMILMDEMLSLPHSLKDGESVVFFGSIKELKEKALYYLKHTEERLAIARKGWEIAMTKHRSWHRLEEMLFGKGLTNTTLKESWVFN